VRAVDRTVVVGTGPPPPPPPVLAAAPPPHPIAKLSMHANPSPQAALAERRFPGTTNVNTARSPAMELSIHHVLRLIGENVRGDQSPGGVCALVLLEGAVVVIVSVAVAAAPLVSVTDVGEIEHVAPGKFGIPPGKLLCGQLSCTVLVSLVRGVIVNVEELVCPAVIVSGGDETAKSGVTTLTKTFGPP